MTGPDLSDWHSTEDAAYNAGATSTEPTWGPDLPEDGAPFSKEVWLSRWPAGGARVLHAKGALIFEPTNGPYDRRDQALAQRTFPTHTVDLSDGILIVHPPRGQTERDQAERLMTDLAALTEADQQRVRDSRQHIADAIAAADGRLFDEEIAAMDAFGALVASSSLGAPRALAIRAHTPPEVRERVQRILALVGVPGGRMRIIDPEYDIRIGDALVNDEEMMITVGPERTLAHGTPEELVAHAAQLARSFARIACALNSCVTHFSNTDTAQEPQP